MNLPVWSLTTFLAVLVLMGPASAGEVYTWTDKDGTIHITDRPPADDSRVDDVIRYSAPPETGRPAAPVPQPTPIQTMRRARLDKRLTRLRERKKQLEKMIEENRESIAGAEKDAAYYRKRSGSYARRNEKAIERQLGVLKNNLATHEKDLRYVEEDLVETRQLIEIIEQDMKRPEDEPGAGTSK